MSLKIPPVVIFLITVAAMFGIYFITEEYTYTYPYRTLISRVFLAAGLLSGILGVVSFRFKGTTVDPTKPDKASQLVINGIYQFTRNPMYLGMGFVLFGGLIRMGNPFCILALIFYFWYITQFQIKPEEKALTKLFEEEYEEYRRRVRRWV